MKVYGDACNAISQVAYDEGGLGSRYRLHHLVYYDIREKFPLTAQLTITAIARVAASYQREGHRLHQFNHHSYALDSRCLSIKQRNGEWQVSIASIEGRQKWIPLDIGDYQKEHLRAEYSRSGAAVFVHDKRTDTFYLHITVAKEVENPLALGKRPLGVDRGVNNLAVTSDGQFFSGRKPGHITRGIRERRALIQARGTRSAKRLLKRLGGRVSRYMSWVNHNISRRLVDHAKATNAVIILEDLKDIRERMRGSKRLNACLHSWPFFQLQQFLEYKALEAGVPVVYVSPRYTSQACSRCGHISGSQRDGHCFKCSACGYEANADFNAANNIALRYMHDAMGACKRAPEATSVDPETASAGLMAS